MLRVASTAYLGRYRGQIRIHTESDLRVFLRWCTAVELDPLAAVRADIDRYVRWLQDVRRGGLRGGCEATETLPVSSALMCRSTA